MEEFDYEEYLDEYFDPMELADEEKEERKDIAKQIRNAMIAWFLLILMYYRFSIPLDEEYLRNSLRSRLATVIYGNATADAYLVTYIDKLSKGLADTTFEDIKKRDKVDENLKVFSDERATEIGANEANTIGNHEAYLRAIEAGMNYKQWRSFQDNRVRKDHERMDGKKIPIRSYFRFPDCKMLYAHDEVNGSAKQVVNCRCLTKYTKN